MRSEVPKQFLTLGDRTVLFHTIEKFLRSKYVNEIIVVVAEEHLKSDNLQTSVPANPDKIVKIVAGGETRQKSVENGLKAVSDNAEFVLTHDGARPLILTKTIDRAIAECKHHNGVIIGLPASDTLAKAEDGEITDYVDRQEIWQLQTPQIFPKEVLEYSFKIANLGDITYTDESSLVRPMFDDIHVFPGEKTNIKITVPEDIYIAKAIMEHDED